MTDSTRTRSLAKEILAATLLAALVIGLGIGFIAPPALGAFFRGGHWQSDPERMRKHADIAVEVALREVDATPEQIARVKEITASLIAELEAAHDSHQAHKDAIVAALRQPEIPREELQALRAQEVALFDDLSVKVTDALVDAAAALTPEQRAQLIDLAEEMHGHGFGH
jgi:Spy/CpxP family protein refolding chaperone